MEQQTGEVELSSPPKPDSQLPDGRRITRQPDGTIHVEGQDKPRIPQSGDFDENLAEYLDTSARHRIADLLIEYERADRDSRKDWEDREKRALEIVGIKDVPRDQDDKAPGFHNLRHPAIATACVQFQARAIAEFFPPSGPVKGSVVGQASDETEEQAERIETFMNYYLTDVDRGYYEDSQQMLFYLPFAGCAFRKCSPDWRTGLPQLRYVKATNFIAPYAGTDLATMPRYAHAYTMPGQDLNRAMGIGMLMDVGLYKPAQGQAMHSPTADAADLRQPIMHEDDELYDMLEYHIEMALDYDGIPDEERNVVLPWIILVEKTNQEVLLVRRNWKREDSSRMKRIWFAKYGFLPGLGFYDFGFPHIIGSLGLAASGAINALLDAAYVSNVPGGFVSKEGRGQVSGEIEFEPGVFKEVDMAAEDLAKMFYKPEVGKPEPALFQLVELLLQGAKEFTQTTEVKVGDASNNGPVGTTVALIEESSRVQTALHKRMHVSAKEEFRMLAEFIYEYMPPYYEYDQNKQTRFLLKSDFDGQVKVIPVSDPNIFSSTQRIALCQAVIQLQDTHPQIYSPAKRVAAHKRLLEALRVPDPDEVGPDDPEPTPQYLDPISENEMITVGTAVHAFPSQDHDAHLAIHDNFVQFMASQPIQPDQLQQVLQAVSAHMREHSAMKYRQLMMKQMGMELPPFDLYGQNPQLPPDIERRISALAAAHLPPPPPTPQQQQQAQEGQQVLNKAQAAIEAKNMDARAKLERDTQAFVADQARREKAHKLEQRRKDQSTASQLIRERARGVVDANNQARRSHLEQHDTMRSLQAREAERRIKFKERVEQAELARRAAEQQAKIKAKSANAAAKKKSAAKKTAGKSRSNGSRGSTS